MSRKNKISFTSYVIIMLGILTIFNGLLYLMIDSPISNFFALGCVYSGISFGLHIILSIVRVVSNKYFNKKNKHNNITHN
jgi:1,4-dihydroxy-2-naphthoate octaprenyltransferase